MLRGFISLLANGGQYQSRDAIDLRPPQFKKTTADQPSKPGIPSACKGYLVRVICFDFSATPPRTSHVKR